MLGHFPLQLRHYNHCMRTQKQKLNALCLLKNIFVPLHCCGLWDAGGY